MAHIKKQQQQKKNSGKSPSPVQVEVHPASTPLMTLQWDGGRTCYLSLFWTMDGSSLCVKSGGGRGCRETGLESGACWATVQPSKLFPPLCGGDNSVYQEVGDDVTKHLAHSRTSIKIRSPFRFSSLVNNSWLCNSTYPKFRRGDALSYPDFLFLP